MDRKDPRPEILRLEELAIAVKNGAIKLPKFQRAFVWKKSDMLRLLDSIYRGYPIGSLLMWNSSQKLTSERSIDGLQIDEDQLISYPVDYLLDGQQRLTTLCGALFWGGGDQSSKWNIHFDLESEQFVYPESPGLVTMFSLNKLLGTSDFIRQCMKLEHHPQGRRLIGTAERLLRSIKDYKIAVVKIGDMTVEEVAPIFERINSTGRKLTIVDLMVAATWSNDFDLGDAIRAMSADVSKTGFGDIKEQHLLRAISAAAGGGINKEALQGMRTLPPKHLISASRDARAALLVAIEFLKRTLKIGDSSRVPYALQLNLLIEYFRLSGGGNVRRESELVRWVWFTTVTRYFASANTGQIVRDLNNIRRFARGEIDQMYERGDIDIGRFVFDNFNMRNSTTVGFTLLLSAGTPARTINGEYMGNGYMSESGSKSYSPLLEGLKQNWAYIIHPSGLPIDTCNVTYVTDHLLNDECAKAMRNNDTQALMKGRLSIIKSWVEDLTQCNAAFKKIS